MRIVDPEHLGEAIEELVRPESEAISGLNLLERLRDDILAAGVSGVEIAMNTFPQADRQQLRQLVLQHQREQKQNKPPAASRKLFRYLREQQEHYGSG